MESKSKTKGVSEMSNQNLIDEFAAAEYLNLSVHTLRVWRCTRRVKLPYIKLGSSCKYMIADLEKFVESGRRGEE